MGLFSMHYRTIAYSRRFHFPNPRLEYGDNYSVGTERDDLVELIRTLKITEPVHLVGASYGGYTCVLVARDYPSLVRTLVISEPPILALLAASDGCHLYTDFKNIVREYVAPYFEKRDYEKGLREYMLRVAGRDFDQIPDDIRTVQLQNAHTLLAEVQAAETENFNKRDASKIDIPTLLLTGERSIPYLKRTALELSKLLPKVTFQTISKAGHSMHTQNPVEYNKLVLDFIGRN
jgi:pimeloyl-ACP methyl ester carboxylesterase